MTFNPFMPRQFIRISILFIYVIQNDTFGNENKDWVKYFVQEKNVIFSNCLYKKKMKMGKFSNNMSFEMF